MKLDSELDGKDDNIMYVVSHTFARGLPGKEGHDRENGRNRRFDTEREAFMLLWSLRNEEEFYAFSDSGDYMLKNLLGEFTASPEVFRAFEPLLEGDIYSFSRMAQTPGDESQKSVKVPGLDDVVKRGLLTDLVSRHGKLVREEAVPEEAYQDDLKYIAEKAGISVDEAADLSIARFNYYLYTIGYLMPHVTNEDSQKALLRMYSKEVENLDDSEKILKERYKIDLKKTK